MAEAYSGATNGGLGDVKCYVSAYVESYSDKQAVVVVGGAVFGNATYGPWGFGVRNRIGIDGVGSVDATGWLNYGDWIASNQYRVTVNRDNGKTLRCWTSFWGEMVDGYGPYPYSNSVAVNIWIEPQVLRPPSAPSGLSAQRSAAGVIGLSWTKNATNAATTQIERMSYNGAWAQIVDTGSVLTSYSDSVGTGTYKYRVRYWNSDGFSGYSNESDWITALCAPAAPSLVSPASGSTLSTSAGNPTIKWIHNSLDTSAQTGAEIKYSVDSWATETQINETSASSVVLPLIGNNDVAWKVRTKGAYTGDGNDSAAWSNWSSAALFRMRTPPSVQVSISPELTAVPLIVSWDYNDAMGTQASAEISIEDSAHAQIYSSSITGSKNTITIPGSDFTPLNGASYKVVVTARSTTSLSAGGTASFTTNYEPPEDPKISLAIDDDSCAVSITCFVGDANETIATSYMSVFRDDDCIANRLFDKSKTIDHMPPTDREVTYRVVAYAESGAVSDTTRKVVVDSGGFTVFNYGESHEQACRIGFNLSENDIKEDLENELFASASYEYPVITYGTHRTISGSLSAVVFDDDIACGSMSDIKAMQAWGRSVVMRQPGREPKRIKPAITVSRRSGNGSAHDVSVEFEAVAS